MKEINKENFEGIIYHIYRNNQGADSFRLCELCMIAVLGTNKQEHATNVYINLLLDLIKGNETSYTI